MDTPSFDLDADTALQHPSRVRAELATSGTCILRGLVPRPPLDEVREVAVRFAQDAGWVSRVEGDHLEAVPGARLSGRGYDDPRWIALQQVVLPHPAFRAVGTHARLRALMDIAFAGAPFQGAQGDICRLLLPAPPDLATRPHQDRFYIAEGPPLWTVWLPLVDCPPEVGGLMVWPGSQQLGLLPHEAEGTSAPGVLPPEEITPCCPHLRPGDAVLFSALTVHGSARNASETRLRLSIDFRYAGADRTAGEY